MAINLVAENNINLLSYSVVSQKYDLGFVRIKIKVLAGLLSFRRFRGGESISCPFQLVDDARIPWLWLTSSTLEVNNAASPWFFLCCHSSL